MTAEPEIREHGVRLASLLRQWSDITDETCVGSDTEEVVMLKQFLEAGVNHARSAAMLIDLLLSGGE